MKYFFHDICTYKSLPRFERNTHNILNSVEHKHFFYNFFIIFQYIIFRIAYAQKYRTETSTPSELGRKYIYFKIYMYACVRDIIYVK